MSKAWVTFTLNERRAGRKTDTWEVWSLDENSHLGTVEWYPPWRKYGFMPEHSTVWDQACLRSIADFIESETEKHKAVG